MIFIDNETEIGKINLLQRWILFHSYLYYEKNTSIVSDYVFDMNAQQLYKMKNNKEYRNSKYYYVFEKFEGNSGFDLFSKLNKVDRLFIIKETFKLCE